MHTAPEPLQKYDDLRSGFVNLSYQSCASLKHTLSQHQTGLSSSVSFRQNVQNSPAARIARSPAQRDCVKAIPHHRATTQDLQELEELGCTMDTGRWLDLLLQHFKCFR
jgi:hypothetical protein